MSRKKRQADLQDEGMEYAEPEKTEILVKTQDIGTIKVQDTDASTGDDQESYELEYKAETESGAKIRADDKQMSSAHQFKASDSYSKKVIFADRPAYEKRSSDIFRESWSYHSLFPSLRTFIPLIIFPMAAIALVFFGYHLGGKMSAALQSFWVIAIAIAVVFFFLESTKGRVSHGLKDALVHGSVLILLLFFAGWNWEIAGSAFLLYVGAHFLMHMMDFHLERTAGRALTLSIYGAAVVFIELFLAVSLFAPYLSQV